MGGEFLYRTNEAVIGLILLALMLAATEIGFRFGRVALRQEEATRSQISNIQTAILAVLGLLLGFSVSMAVSRFERRQQLVIDESNAIGTAYLRAQLISAPEGADTARLLRDYLDARLQSTAPGRDRKLSDDANALAVRLQDECWAQALAFAQKDPRSVTTGLLLDALSHMIDLEATRAATSANHVPETVIYVDALVSIIACLLVGYGYGLGKIRHQLSAVMLALAIVLVLLLILDLDRPRDGLIRVSQRAMLQLRDRLHAMSH